MKTANCILTVTATKTKAIFEINWIILGGRGGNGMVLIVAF